LLAALRDLKAKLEELKTEARGPGKHTVFMELYEAGNHINTAIDAETNRLQTDWWLTNQAHPQPGAAVVECTER
jgi:hypothetical protein